MKTESVLCDRAVLSGDLPPARAKRERPILFSAPMVRALLAGTKTQTRRVVKPEPIAITDDGHPFISTPQDQKLHRLGRVIPCPYGQPGERLWVREAVVIADDRTPQTSVVYRADLGDTGRVFSMSEVLPWRPSIHMPRWASRTLLEVTEVSVERLQDISEEDSLAEGIQAMRCPDCHLAAYGLPGWGHDELNPTAQGAYRYLWESINGVGSWDANPWVWAVSFRVEPVVGPITQSEVK